MWRRLGFLFAAVTLLCLYSCSEDSATNPPADNNDSDPVVEEVIGAAGGEIAVAEITITVPAGAFSGDVDLSLTYLEGDSPFSNQDRAGQYRLEGLPIDFSDSLSVSVLLLGDKADGPSHAAFGSAGWAPSAGEVLTAWRILPATDSEGYRTFKIPPSAEATAKDGDTQTIEIALPENNGDYKTASGHFAISYDPAIVNQADVIAMGGFLENAHSYFRGRGYSYSARTDTVITVTVTQLPPERYGVFVASGWSVNSCLLEFNQAMMSQSAEMQVTAGHEFFHLVQHLYDPRSTYDRGGSGGPQWWFDEASAVWEERNILGLFNYVSAVRTNNQFTPLSGIAAGLTVGHQDHGYGLSSLLLFIEDMMGQGEYVHYVYDSIKLGAKSVAALLDVVGSQPATWWHTYLQELIGGELYGDVTPELVVNNRSALWQIADAGDTLQIYEAQYPDLSGKLYFVRLDFDGIAEDTSLKLKVEGWSPAVAIWKRVGDQPLAFLGDSPDSLTIDGLRDLTLEDAQLLVLVSNARAEGPDYDTSVPVKLTMQVKKPSVLPGFDEAYLSIHYQAQWAGDPLPPPIPDQGLNISTVSGHMEENLFIAEWDSLDTESNVHHSGYFYATFDPETKQLIDWSARVFKNYTWNAATDDFIVSGAGRIRVGYETDAVLRYDLSDDDVCVNVQNISVLRIDGDGQIAAQLVSYSCNDEYSSLRIRFEDSRPDR